MPIEDRVPGGHALLHEAQEEAFAARVARSPNLGRVFTGILTPAVSLSPVGSADERVGRLMFRTDVLRHVRLLSGSEGPGVWVPEVYADGMGLGPGDAMRLAYEGGTPVEVQVAGVYGTLWTGPRSGYWRSWYGEIWPCLLCDPPPQPIFGDRALVFDLMGRLGIDTASFAWDAPLRDGDDLTMPEARDLGAFVGAFLEDVSGDDPRLTRLFRCCGVRFLPIRTDNAFLSAIPSVLTVVDRRMAALEGPVGLLTLAALLVALAAVAGAGAFATAARRVESALLSARGRGPLTMGLKGALEAILPALLGAGVGLGVTLLLVAAVGPGGGIPGSVVLAQAGRVVVALTGAVVLVGLISAVASGRPSEGRRHLPLPLDLALAAGFLLVWIGGRGAFVTDTVAQVQRPSLALLSFPILALAGIGVLGARLLRGGLAWARDRSERLPPAAYLAVHRSAGAGALALLLTAGAVASLGTFLHARTVAHSLDHTIRAKARIWVGSDAAGDVDLDYEPPPDLGLPVTKATRWRSQGTLRPLGIPFDVLAVDPATLPAAAYWEDGFSGVSLEELARRLVPDGSGPLPAVVVGLGGDPPANLTIDAAQQQVPIRVVGTATAFPGTSTREPLVVVDSEALQQRYGTANPLVTADTELWVRADPARAEAALGGLGIQPVGIRTAREVEGVPSIAAARSMFGVLGSLGTVSGLLVLVVLLMYLQSRQRSQIVSYALSRRMGLASASHRRAVHLETGLMLGTALALGAAGGLALSIFVLPRLDPVPTITPGPLFSTPWASLVTAVAVLAAVVWMAGRLTDRRASAADLGQVMRVAE